MSFSLKKPNIAASDDYNGWTIDDNDKDYTVLPDGDKLVVYQGRFEAPAGTITFNVPDEWRQQLKDHGVLLSPRATIASDEDNVEWTITTMASTTRLYEMETS